MKKKFISSLLAVSMLASMSTTAFAVWELEEEDNTVKVAGSATDVPVELTVTPLSFSVTVPSVLPITVNGNGEVSVATNTKIVNNSQGKVEVKDLTVTTGGSWNLVPMTDDFANKAVNTKDFGMSFNGADAATEELESTFAVINANSEQAFTYDAKLAPQSEEIVSEQIASAVFTIGWSISQKPVFSMVHKPTGDTNVIEDGFRVKGYEILDAGDEDPVNFAANNYFATVKELTSPIKNPITRDLTLIDYGELGTFLLDKSMLGLTIGDVAEYSVLIDWPEDNIYNDKTRCDFVLTPMTINGETINVASVSYTWFDYGDEEGFSGGSNIIWTLDKATNEFVLVTEDTVITENMVLYSDVSDSLINAVNN